MKKMISREKAARRLLEADRAKGLFLPGPWKDVWDVYLSEAEHYLSCPIEYLTTEIEWFEEVE